jgi:hypothetical protein
MGPSGELHLLNSEVIVTLAERAGTTKAHETGMRFLGPMTTVMSGQDPLRAGALGSRHPGVRSIASPWWSPPGSATFAE